MTIPALSETIAADLKAAMRQMPTAVALITTHDREKGVPAGLAASAVIPVSMDPSSMLVSINQSASAHDSIDRAGSYCINLLGTAQASFVAPFSNSALRSERFASSEWQFRDDITYFPGACCNIFCTVRETLAFGSHRLFIGEVYDIQLGVNDEADPLGWIKGNFARLNPLET